MAQVDWSKPSLAVFFGNLDDRVTEAMLYQLGCQAGPVAKVRLNADGKKKAFAFVEFEHLESAIYCVGLYHKLLHLYGAAVSVAFSKNEYPAGDMSEEQHKLISTMKKLLACTAELGGGGPVRHHAHQGAHRYKPYVADSSFSSPHNDPQQSGYPETHQDHKSWSYTGHQRQQQSVQNPEPVHGWQERAAAAAAAAAASFGAQLTTAQEQPPAKQWQAPPVRAQQHQHLPMQAQHASQQQQQQLHLSHYDQQPQAHPGGYQAASQQQQQQHSGALSSSHGPAPPKQSAGTFSSSSWNATMPPEPLPQQPQLIAAAAAAGQHPTAVQPSLQYQQPHQMQGHGQQVNYQQTQVQYQQQPQVQYQQQPQQLQYQQQPQVQYQQQLQVQYQQQPQVQYQQQIQYQQQPQQVVYMQPAGLAAGAAGAAGGSWQQHPQQQVVYAAASGQPPVGATLYYMQA